MSLFSDLNGLKFNTSKSYLVPKFSVPAQAIQSHYKVALCSDKLRVFGIKYRRFLQRGNDSVHTAFPSPKHALRKDCTCYWNCCVKGRKVSSVIKMLPQSCNFVLF